MQQVPNFLTFLRLLLIPVFVGLMVDPSPQQVYAALVVFCIAALTDYVDGYLARRLGAVSDFGKLLDPVADKILVLAALIMLVGQRSDQDAAPWVDHWLVVLVVAREIWVTGLRSVAAASGVIVAASSAGKLKSGLQMVAIILLLLHEAPLYPLSDVITCQRVGLNVLLLSIAISYWGATEYTCQILGSMNAYKAAPGSVLRADEGDSAIETALLSSRSANSPSGSTSHEGSTVSAEKVVDHSKSDQTPLVERERLI